MPSQPEQGLARFVLAGSASTMPLFLSLSLLLSLAIALILDWNRGIA
jgi:hypothetical protein